MTEFDKIIQSSNYLKKIYPNKVDVLMILGSGLGDYAKQIQNPVIINFSQIPHFGQATVEGHEGQLILGVFQGLHVAILKGRLHIYEGHSEQDVVRPIRVVNMLGAKNAIITNASGGINNKFHPGDLVIINDHLNLSGKNPLIGANIQQLGPRFPDMTEAYDRQLIELMKNTADEINYNIKDGVYCYLLGPTYETPAEIRMLRTLGADMVGMSTVPEVIAANHAGMKVAAVACITNYAAGIKPEKLSHHDVKIQALKSMETFTTLLNNFLQKLKQTNEK